MTWGLLNWIIFDSIRITHMLKTPQFLVSFGRVKFFRLSKILLYITKNVVSATLYQRSLKGKGKTRKRKNGKAETEKRKKG